MTEPKPDWPDVLPGAFVVTPRKAPYALAIGCIVLIIVGLAAVAATASSGARLLLMVIASVVGLAGVSLFFRLLQAGKPQLVADAVGVRTTLNPARIPWNRVAGVRIIANRIGGGARIGITPKSIPESLNPRMASDRLIKMLESRQQREGATFVVNLAATGISPDEARQRLTELAADRTPVTD